MFELKHPCGQSRCPHYGYMKSDVPDFMWEIGERTSTVKQHLPVSFGYRIRYNVLMNI